LWKFIFETKNRLSEKDRRFALELNQAQCLQEQQGQQCGSDELYHHRIELFTAELESAVGNFFDNGLGLNDPADKDADNG